jgi:hypothetical protein
MENMFPLHNLNRWTLGLAVAGIASCASANRVITTSEEESAELDRPSTKLPIATQYHGKMPKPEVFALTHALSSDDTFSETLDTYLADRHAAEYDSLLKLSLREASHKTKIVLNKPSDVRLNIRRHH